MTREEFLSSLVAEVFSWDIVTFFSVHADDPNETEIITWDHLNPKCGIVIRTVDLVPLTSIYFSTSFIQLRQYWMDIKKEQETNRSRIFGNRYGN